MGARGLAVGTTLLLVACSGAPSASGLGEPLRIREGTFVPGALPASHDGGAQVTDIERFDGPLQWFQQGKGIMGRTTPDGYTVAVRFADLGSGYWIVPVGGMNPTQNDERNWAFTADLGGAIPPGNHNMRFVAIDGSGQAGPVNDAVFCITGNGPDTEAACNKTGKPPLPVMDVGLSWDSNVDLDLIVLTPEGKTIDWKHPTDALPVDGKISATALSAPDLGALTRDSNVNCAIDSIRREDIVWRATPRKGTWRFYANLYSACGQPSVYYRGTLYRGSAPDGTLLAERSVDGQMTAQQANGGTKNGFLFLELTIP